jgi:hypothetical protein
MICTLTTTIRKKIRIAAGEYKITEDFPRQYDIRHKQYDIRHKYIQDLLDLYYIRVGVIGNT